MLQGVLRPRGNTKIEIKDAHGPKGVMPAGNSKVPAGSENTAAGQC